MQRLPLKQDEQLLLNNKKYTITSVIGDGATCIVYSAYYIDTIGISHKVNIKECYPYNANINREGQSLIWASEDEKDGCIKAFVSAYEKLMLWQNTNFFAHAFDICEANQTRYIIMNADEGVTFDKDTPASLTDILKTVKLLAHVVGNYHNNGYLHLDIKPTNFLVYPRPSEHIVLFDMDTVTAIDDIKSGKVKGVSYSEGWAAPEQKQGKINKLCPATDIYAIGAVLFEKIMGRPVEAFDSSAFADWNFDNEMFENVNPKIKRLLRNIFKKTLAANTKRRHQNTADLILDLNEAIKVLTQDTYLISDYIITDFHFIERKNELQKMHESFSNNTKAIFLHGFGGVGKTSLAIRYAELHKNEYDCIKFCRYTNGLSNIIDNFDIANCKSKNKNEYRKTLKTVFANTNTLIIIDNFDVEDDEDLDFLLSLNCTILFTTRNDYSQYISSEKIEIIELEAMSTNSLVQVFKNEYKKDLSKNEEKHIKEIIEKFGNVTFIVPIIAKQIIASRADIETFALSIRSDIFARFDEDNEDIRIRKDGRSSKTNSLDYIRAVFNIAKLPEEHKTVLRYLYLLRYHYNLKIEDYRKYTGTKNLNVLNDLAFRNWITIDDDDRITVHQLIYDLTEKDFYPTYESVPGITQYIDSCFEILKNSITDDNNVDWDAVSCITFALLMYLDINSTEETFSRDQKKLSLFTFMCAAFLNNKEKLYNLLFTQPSNSIWYIYIHGIMNLFVPFDISWTLLVLQVIETQNNDTLCYRSPDTKSSVQFSNIEEKKEFSDLMKKEYHLEFYKFYLTMFLYFNEKSGDKNTNKSLIEALRLTFEDFSKNENSSESEHHSADLTKNKLLQLDFFLSACKSPRYNSNVEYDFKDGLSVIDNYEYYVLVLQAIQNMLSTETEKDIREKCFREAEKLIIVLEEYNDHFIWYGLSEPEILTYNPQPIEDYIKTSKLHWAQKADIWYDSVEKILRQTEQPYNVYKLLLKFYYQKEVLSTSKINKLIKKGLVDSIYNDNRLDFEEKQALLIDFVINQIQLITKLKRKPSSTFIKKHSATLHLYLEAISKADTLLPDFHSYILNNQNVSLMESAFILRKMLKQEPFDIKGYVKKCISHENISYIGELIRFADKIRTSGYAKLSHQLKSSILDLCVETNFNELKEEIIQIILYKVRPLAVNYKRQDVVTKIDKLDMTTSRKYHLALLDSTHAELFSHYETQNIAKRFLNDYIEIIVTETFFKIHMGETNKIIDELEQIFLKYAHHLFLQVQNLRYPYFYSDIFGNRAIGEKTPKDAIHQISPFELSKDTYASYNPIIDMGVCYMIAEVYDEIPYESKFNCPLDAVLGNDGSEKDYTLSPEETQDFLNNIIKICPKAKKDIDRYFNT